MGGGGGMFSSLTKNWKTGAAFASSGLSTLFPNAISESTTKEALDPLNISGMNTPEIETLPAPSKTSTTVTDLEVEASKASKAESDRLKKRKGYKETVLTSVSGSLDSPTTLKQTLGGT
jgi:hypothetical protein